MTAWPEGALTQVRAVSPMLGAATLMVKQIHPATAHWLYMACMPVIGSVN
jgi:hypothetical protein